MPIRIFISALVCLFASQLSADEKPEQVPLDPKAGTYESGPFRYVLTDVISNDSSVTRVGTLFRGGRPVAGSDYFRLELPIGSFIWYPPKPSAPNDSPLAGWIRIDPRRKYPRFTMAVIDPDSTPDAKVWRTVERNPALFQELKARTGTSPP